MREDGGAWRRAEEGCSEWLSYQTNVCSGIQQVCCLDRCQVWSANSGMKPSHHTHRTADGRRLCLRLQKNAENAIKQTSAFN